MQHSDLRRLAEHGLAAFPPDALGELAEWLRDYCWHSGQVAYCILNDVVALIERRWSHGLASVVAEDLSRQLHRELPAILDAADVDMARVLALHLRQQVLDTFNGA